MAQKFGPHIVQYSPSMWCPARKYPCARHTWATMAYYCEVHPGVISEAMGHSSITVTETYLKPFKNKKIDEANVAVISSLKKDCGACKFLS